MRLLARLIFLGLVVMTGFVTYNALYMQQLRSAAISRAEETPPPPAVSAVTTDTPDLGIQEAPEQLVTAIQRELTARGYAPGPVDGTLRDETRKAISAFEKDKGLEVTGTPTDELLRLIILGETMIEEPSVGSVAEAPLPDATQSTDDVVKKVQQILADLGYAPGPIDGAMSKDTEQALLAFQRDRKLDQTGRITSHLLAEIKRVTGRDIAGLAAKP